MTIRHYRMPWPDTKVPSGEPVWVFYEVDVAQDNVLRMVEVFPDGVSSRNDIAIEALHGPGMETIVDGPFMQHLEGHDYTEIPAEIFEQTWQSSKDTAYWNIPK